MVESADDEAVGWRAPARPEGLLAAACCAGAFLCCAVPSQAQFDSYAPSEVRFVSLTVERPVHPDGFDMSSVIGHAAVGIPLNPQVTFVGGVSLAHAREPQRPPSTVMSNVWVEVHFGGEGGFGTLTLTLPTSEQLVNAESYAANAGIAADVQRPERFTNDATGVAFRLNPRWSVGSSGTVGARAGLAVVKPGASSNEFYARFGGFGETVVGSARLGAEVTGAWTLNPSSFGGDLTAGEVTTSQATIFVGLPAAVLGPHLFVRIPLDDDARRQLRTVIGVRLDY